MIVVDTNVLACLWMRSDMSSLADAALTKDSAWAAPVLWRSEFRNILVGYLRRNELTEEKALRAFEGAVQTLNGREFGVATNKVLRLAMKSACSAYDCEFVVLAQDLEVKLVTCDNQILKDFPAIAVSLKDFVKLK